MDVKATILLVEDDGPQRLMLAGHLRKAGYRVIEADSAASAMKAAPDPEPDILLTDLRLGGPDGVTLLVSLREKRPDLQAIVMTAYGTVEDAVRAMRGGAYDFITKPVDLGRLDILIEKAVEKGALQRENRRLVSMVGESDAFAGLIGDSEPMMQVRRLAARVAMSRASVLILGESGTGKEVLAHAIHMAGQRRDRRFVTVNCAALPETLIESELFGHEKGAFTGASARRPGRFEIADGGTLFLDEVGEIPLPVQVKLLNVLQSGRFERVGGNETVQSDVRIIAATNRDLAARVREGHFREDLYYRLNVVSITMPALRDRPGDIPLLAAHFIGRYSPWSGNRVTGISEAGLERLTGYGFPGNVRELENWIERAVVLAEEATLGPWDFPESDHPAAGSDGGPDAGNPAPGGLDAEVAALEAKRISAALSASNGNQSAAARELGISERMIRYKIRKYSL